MYFIVGFRKLLITILLGEGRLQFVRAAINLLISSIVLKMSFDVCTIHGIENTLNLILAERSLSCVTTVFSFWNELKLQDFVLFFSFILGFDIFAIV